MEIVMINDVVLERIVANIWRYAVALLFRLACYRHTDLPPKPLNEDQDAADFITIRVPKGNLSAWVHGFLHSRDYAVSLADFLKDNRGEELTVPDNHNPSELHAPRGITEAAVSHIMS
jgi:hypothetical protein